MHSKFYFQPSASSTLSNSPMMLATELITSTEHATPRTNVRTKEASPVGLALMDMEFAAYSPSAAEIRYLKIALILRVIMLPVVLATLKFAVATKIFAKCDWISLPSKLLTLPLPLPL